MPTSIINYINVIGGGNIKSLIDTQTVQNLLCSYANECQTYTRYTFYSQKARKEGYIQISNIFMETAEHEKGHAETFLYFLKKEFNDTMVQFNISSPLGLHDETNSNLEGAVHIENELWTKIYPGYARIALKEGFTRIARVFEKIALAEKMHDKRFSILMNNLNCGLIFARNEPVKWKCNNCGYIHVGKYAPEKCPSCAHPQGYFEIFCENY